MKCKYVKYDKSMSKPNELATTTVELLRMKQPAFKQKVGEVF